VTDDVSDIVSFYDRQVVEEDARLERHQLERDLTWRFCQYPSVDRQYRQSRADPWLVTTIMHGIGNAYIISPLGATR
jgi:hypothetical protein